MPSGEPARRKPRLRFSIRSLLVLLTAVSLWCGYYYSRVSTQRGAAQAIQEAGGKIVYDWQIEGDEPSQPKWLRQLLGPHFFDEIIHVRLQYYWRHGRTDLVALGPHLKRLPRLESLSLSGEDLESKDYHALGTLDQLEELGLGGRCSLDDSDAAELARMASLRSLRIGKAIITPHGVAQLAKLPNLRRLSLGSRSEHKMTDEHARSVASSKSLRELYLHDTLISNEGMAALGRLENLESVTISSPRITGAVLKDLKSLSRLHWLGTWQWQIEDEDLLMLNELPSLTGVGLNTSTSVTDQSVPYLAKLNRLEILRIGSRCQITDAGLEPFKSMTQLKRLDLSGSQVDKLGPAAKELLAALPECAIQLPKTARENEMEAAFHRMKFGGPRTLIPAKTE